jgi:hypothetical protein
MFWPHFETSADVMQITREHFTMVIIALFFAFITLLPIGQRWCDAVFEGSYTNRRHILLFGISVMLFTLSVGRILNTGFNPFIYFRF